MRVTLIAVLVGLVLAGCGGSETAATSAEGAASIAPKSAALYVTVNTDVDSSQVNQLEQLLAKFPDRDKLFERIQSSLHEENVDWETDVRPALGKTLDVVLLDLKSEDAVGILKPADKAKFEALLAKGDKKPVSREIDGWTVVAEDVGALDRFEQARTSGALEDDARFTEAMNRLPDDALAKLYVNGQSVTKAAGEAAQGNQLEAFAAALGAQSSGLRLDGALKADLRDGLASVEPYEPKLLDAAPEGAYAFLSGNGHGKVQQSLRDIPGVFAQAREYLGLDAGEIARLFEGEFALWVAKGIPIPEVTFLAEAKDEERSLSAVDLLVKRFTGTGGERRTIEVDGVQAKQVVLDGFPLTYAAFDGKVIVTTRPGAIADVRDDGGSSFADDSRFKDAQGKADMGDTTFGFLYLDVHELAALVEGFAGLNGSPVPPEVSRNLEPLGTFLLQAGGKPEELKLSAFLAIE